MIFSIFTQTQLCPRCSCFCCFRTTKRQFSLYLKEQIFSEISNLHHYTVVRGHDRAKIYIVKPLLCCSLFSCEPFYLKLANAVTNCSQFDGYTSLDPHLYVRTHSNYTLTRQNDLERGSSAKNAHHSSHRGQSKS